MKTANLPFVFWLLFITSATFPQQASWPNMVRVSYRSDANRYIDDIVIRFSDNPSVTTNESTTWDARTLNCCDFIASMKGNSSFAIQTRPANFTSDTVRLRVVSSSTGHFKLSFSEFAAFLTAKKIILSDAYTGMQHDIKQSPVYDFSITADPSSQGATRFSLIFIAEPVFINCPHDISINNTPGMSGANVDFIATATGRCGPVEIHYSRSPGSFFEIGTSIVTVIAKDSCGNTLARQFAITVRDNEAPLIDSVYPLALPADPGACSRRIALDTPLATDNSRDVFINGIRSDGAPLSDPFEKGTTIVTWTATDPSGNTSSIDQSVTIEDKEAPLLIPAVLRQAYEPNYAGCSFKVNDNRFDPLYSDNCTGVTLTNDLNHTNTLQGAILPAGKMIVTWTATDAAGNSSTIAQAINIVSPLKAFIPDASAMTKGVTANTLYVGYSPAEVIVYTTAEPGSDCSYAWSVTGNISVAGAANSPGVKVISLHAGEGNLSLQVSDRFGCSVTANKKVIVTDIRCDSRTNRVQLCLPARGRSECIGSNAVSNLVDAGYMLGGCANGTAKRDVLSEAVAAKPVVQLYPNPAKDKCVLRFDGFKQQKVRISVTDPLGRTIFQHSADIVAETQLAIDLSNNAAGVYEVRIITKENVTSKKLVLLK